MAVRVMTLHTYPLVRPTDLAGQQNGRLNPDLLRPTDGGDVMHHLAARAFNAMYAHAKRMGVTLTMTDGYRDYDTQQRLFTTRYQRTYNPFTTTTQSKVWNSVRYWKRRGVATAAVPGTSNHGWGLATDIASVTASDGDDDVRWLDEFAADYGFSWELLPEEPWHIRYVTGDRIPTAVLLHEAGNQQPPPPAPAIGATPMRFYKTELGNFYAVYYANVDGVVRLVAHHVTGEDWNWLGQPAAELRTDRTEAQIHELVQV